MKTNAVASWYTRILSSYLFNPLIGWLTARKTHNSYKCRNKSDNLYGNAEQSTLQQKCKRHLNFWALIYDRRRKANMNKGSLKNIFARYSSRTKTCTGNVFAFLSTVSLNNRCITLTVAHNNSIINKNYDILQKLHKKIFTIHVGPNVCTKLSRDTLVRLSPVIKPGSRTIASIRSRSLTYSRCCY